MQTDLFLIQDYESSLIVDKQNSQVVPFIMQQSVLFQDNPNSSVIENNFNKLKHFIDFKKCKLNSKKMESKFEIKYNGSLYCI